MCSLRAVQLPVMLIFLCLLVSKLGNFTDIVSVCIRMYVYNGVIWPDRALQGAKASAMSIRYTLSVPGHVLTGSR